MPDRGQEQKHDTSAGRGEERGKRRENISDFPFFSCTSLNLVACAAVSYTEEADLARVPLLLSVDAVLGMHS